MTIVRSVPSSYGRHFQLRQELLRLPSATHFSRFGTMRPIYIHSSLSLFNLDSVFNVQNRTRQCFCMNYVDHACICTNFLKILQGSSNFCKTQQVLYFLNNGGSRISNMTFPCVMKVIKAMKVMKVMKVTLHISEFFAFL